MRLIGGNISDTPVKEVGDGSAFNVGGSASGGVPSFLTIGAFTSAVAITATGWDDGASTRGATGFAGSTLVYALPKPTLLVNVTIRETDDKVYAGTIPISALGVLGTPTTAQDLSGDFTSTAASATVICIANPAVTDGIVIAHLINASPRKVMLGYYTVSDSGTFTKVGSIQTFTCATNAATAFEGNGMALSTDGNTGVLFMQNNDTTGQLQAIPFNFATNQGFGTAVASGIAQDNTAGATTTYMDETTGKILSITSSNRFFEWIVTTGSTPSIAFTTDHSGAGCTNLHGGHHAKADGMASGLATGVLHKDLDSTNPPADVLECMRVSNSSTVPIKFSGVTYGNHDVNQPTVSPPFMERPGNSIAWNGPSSYVHVKYSADGEYSKGVLCNAYNPIMVVPVLVNLSTGCMISPENATAVTLASFGPSTLNQGGTEWFYSGGKLTCMSELSTDTNKPDYWTSASITDPDD